MTHQVGKHSVGVGVGAYIMDGQKVLLMFRPKTISPHRTTVGMWSVPGGQIDFGETAENAVIREAKEELGIEISIKKFIGYSNQILSKAHWVSLHFLCQIESGVSKIMETEKCERIEWFDVGNLPENSGITHVLRPSLLLGYLNKEEFNKRSAQTKES
ncbi:NUDIX domain-containing protein [Patescibacteria group bacterium]